MSPIAVKFGRVVRRAREARRLSQEALADLANVSRSFLSEIERGSASPSLETMQKLADAFGEQLSYLIVEYEKNNEPT
jgi:transcriptional regulator with XRE-family HTH domain